MNDQEIDQILFLDGAFRDDPYIEGAFRDLMYDVYHSSPYIKARIDMALAADMLMMDDTSLSADKSLGQWRVAVTATGSLGSMRVEYATESFVKVDYHNGA